MKLKTQMAELRGRIPEEHLITLVEDQKRTDFKAEEEALFAAEKVTPERMKEACDDYKQEDREIAFLVQELEKLMPKLMPLKEFLVVMEKLLQSTSDTMEQVISSSDESEPNESVHSKLQMALKVSRQELLKKNNLTEELLQICTGKYFQEKELVSLLTHWNGKMETVLSKYNRS